MTESYIVRVFDARPRSSTAGQVCWLKTPGDVRAFARMKERAFRFQTRGQAEHAVERLPGLYHARVEPLASAAETEAAP